jgi:hypothetical protein
VVSLMIWLIDQPIKMGSSIGQGVDKYDGLMHLWMVRVGSGRRIVVKWM